MGSGQGFAVLDACPTKKGETVAPFLPKLFRGAIVKTKAIWLIKTAALFAALALTACGGSGSADSMAPTRCSQQTANSECGGSLHDGSTNTATAGTVAATVQLLVSSQQLNSNGSTSVGITLIARDANGQVIANRPVQFSVSDPANTAFISNFSQTTGTTHSTNANGQLTATLSLGGNKANRAITVTATVDKATASNSVTVVGTTLTISGSNALGFGASTQLNLLVTDSSAKPIPNTSVTVTSSSGNTIALGSQATDANGKVIVTVTGTKSGSDTIAASAAGASASYVLNVSSNSFSFTSPVSGVISAVGTPLTVTVHWTNNGVPVALQPVNFATTRGSLSVGQSATNASGDVTVTVSSSFPGPATITASSPANGGLAASVNVVFISQQPANSLGLQADKTTVGTNPPGTSANVATLTAVARDIDNNLVSGAIVNFHIDQDPTGGSLSPASATTDFFGVAKTQYIPTSLSSPTNGVIISATTGSVASRPLQLTVGGQNLFVRIGTDNVVGTTSGSPNYTKKYSAFVTDSAGNPVPNATIQFLVRPRQDAAFDTNIAIAQFFNRGTEDYAYFKGKYVWNGVMWVPRSGDALGSPVGCFNEDVNFNGIIFDAGEDYNNNGVLDPGNAFSVNSDNATNSEGYALATITYPKDRANWLAVTLKATVQVPGTEASASATFTLPVASADVSSETVSPPGFFSPYGVATDCSNPQ